jgi:hypothetical protein
MKKSRLIWFGVFVAGVLGSGTSEASAQECVCPETVEEAEPDTVGTDDPALAPEQTHGTEPNDFEFEAPPTSPFDQEQTQGNEPDDFEFEGE